MIDEAVAAVVINDEKLIEIGFLGADGTVRRHGLTPSTGLIVLIGGVTGLAAAFLLVFAQGLVVAFLAARHGTEQVVGATSDVPFKECAAPLRVDVKVLLIALYNQLVLGVAVKVGKLEALPVACSMQLLVGGCLCLNQVVIDGGAHMTHIDATE